MSTIKNSGFPLAYKLIPALPASSSTGHSALQTTVQALTGMQKEAFVTDHSTGSRWRLVSDEGPYLNGTDLAPFPLAFFTTGMALSFTDALLAAAVHQNIHIDQFQLIQDNYYTMSGSAIRGDMLGGALPVAMALDLETTAAPAQIQTLIAAAKQRSPAQALLTQCLSNTFSLQHNGQTTAVTPLPSPAHPEPAPDFSQNEPLPENTYAPDIITKQTSAETVFGVDGGAGSSLQAAQKRTLHVRGICRLRPDGLKQVDVQLFKPIGSTFRFLGDDAQSNSAPSGLVYLSAGIGFCFMTQIGRYAHITKQNLSQYSIVQETSFTPPGQTAAAAPVATHVYLTSAEPDDVAQKTVVMSERTCFLHAAMRHSIDTEITVQLNGTAL